YYSNRSDKYDVNAFARANVSISSAFSAFADVQYRHIDYRLWGANDNFDYTTDAMQTLDYRRRYDFFNPKVGVNFTDGFRNRAFASWSVAHKEPTRSNFTDGDPAHVPSAERLFDYEIGYSYSHPLFAIGVNLYYMDYKDQLVVTGQLSDTGNPLSVNVPRSYRAGVELQARLFPCRWFDWQINATLSRNRIRNFTEYIYEDGWTNPISNYIGSTPIAFSPDFTLNNAFNFSVAGFTASLRSHYVSKQYMSNAHSSEELLDAYFVSDLYLGYTFKSIARLRELRLGVDINNLFNARYESNGYSGAGYYVDPDGRKVIYRYAGYAAQAPINALASVTIKF
ncbi:MAG: TonB-dependent receptor, partial [Muribaculaceae bacterium]|nr:TonB-dependent receptor [Muribaculaceae bacterium]